LLKLTIAVSPSLTGPSLAKLAVGATFCHWTSTLSATGLVWLLVTVAVLMTVSGPSSWLMG
jgi:hypothetical protein